LQKITICNSNRFLRGGVISSEENEFVEKFSAEIEIPCTIPTWLWGGRVDFVKHPTLKLKFLDPGIVQKTTKKPVGGVGEGDRGESFFGIAKRFSL